MKHHVFQIFRSGTHTAGNGLTINCSESDLKRTAAAYKLKPSAPLVLGHPENDKPVYGKVLGLFAQGNILYAQAEVSEGLKKLVKAQRYRYVSASFIPPDASSNPYPGVYFLKHVGFLGAVPPVVKGMTPPEFSENLGAFCFGEECDSPEFSAAETMPHTYSEQLHDQILHYQDVVPTLDYRDALDFVLSIKN